MAPKVAGVTSRKNKKGLRSAATSGDYICHHCHKNFNADGLSEFNAHQNAFGISGSRMNCGIWLIQVTKEASRPFTRSSTEKEKKNPA